MLSFRRHLLWILPSVAVALPLAFSSVACVDTKGEVDDYLSRTATLRVPTDASIDIQLADASAFSGDYFVICAPFAVPSSDNTLRFRAKVDATETSISMTLRVLKGTATSIAQTNGGEFPTPAATATITGGKFLLPIGTTPEFPADSNPITNAAISVDGLEVHGLMTNPPSQFCANLKGTARPTGLEVTTEKSACLFLRVASESETVTIPAIETIKCP